MHRRTSSELLILPFLLGPVLATGLLRAEDPALTRGNEAFHAGRFEEAAQAYESEETRDDLLTRRFNAGVSWEHAGALDRAIERYQEVAAKADGDLRRAALYNSGCAALLKARELAGSAEKVEDAEGRAAKLAEAARSFKSSVDLFRAVEPPDPASLKNLAAAKTSLRATLDAIARLEEEKRRKEEEEALKSPAQAIERIAEKERLHRRVSQALAREAGQNVRLGSRRLRKSTAENRALAEKLQHALLNPTPAAPPAAPGQQAPPPPEPSAEEKERLARAAEAVGKAIDLLKEAELAHSKLEAAGAALAHTKVVAELRTARELFPLDIGKVIAEAAQRQESLLPPVEELAKMETGGLTPGSGGTGFGERVVEAIKDKVLLPLAKMLSARGIEDARLLADDEEDVVWGAGIVARAEIPPSAEPPGGASGQPHGPGQPPPEPGQSPHLSAEEARKLSEGLQAAGKEARAAATAARDALAAAHPSTALAEARKALEALRKAADLLPRPPRDPVERLKELLERQRGASQAVGALADLEEAARQPARKTLEDGQRKDGREAGEIAGELEARAGGGQSQPGAGPTQPPAQIVEATKKVREGEEKVFTSAELLAQARDPDARTAVDRDVQLFQEALDLLQGKQQEKKEEEKEGDQGQEKQPQEQKKQDQGQQKGKDKKEQKPYALSPRDARFRQQEMDRKRREEEKKLFTAPSTLTVEKDW